MSTTVMAACWPLTMPPAPKAVLISLADNANDDGECWPSIPYICARTCYGRTAVIDAIKFLEAQQLVVADRSNGRHTTYRVTVTLDLFAKTKPVRHADRSAKRTGPPTGPNPSATRTAPVRQADSNRQEPSRTKSESEHSPVDELKPEPSQAGAIAKALRAAGIAQVNPSHPKLLALIDAGITEREFVDAAAEIAGSAKATLPYLCGVLAGRRTDAAAGVVPPKPASSPQADARFERSQTLLADQREHRARAGPRQLPAELARTLGLTTEPKTP